ncbi:MAG: Gfo/Idh/MocA family oxidoreductase [Candidatus Fournierella pullistercoris]|uniref:Gfo/Idh/MocA family oxidoreductase n=1 Tax=Candidatus Allofournierella pullistercoris TaxID=2838597 RepID=A0A948WSK5_9FIRM|nr:Gfo/Idh/MocA family oxidoreductase [Candidatus Fournierella pullistercoris]
MKVLFVGLGSIGKRHLGNMLQVSQEMGIEVTVDALRSGNRPLPPEIEQAVAHQYTQPEELGRYDIAFITNPTHLHQQTILELADKVDAFFIEKPIVDDCTLDVSALHLDGKKAYVAAPMRWCGAYLELKRQLAQIQPYCARVICSSYLPDWRPGVDYRTVYSAHRDMGGGVTIDLIHEWDYLVDLLGQPLECYNLKGTYSHLEIDSDDLSVYIARYPNLLAEVHLDYFGRGYRRSIELMCQDGSLVADFGQGTVTLPSGETIHCEEPVNQRYLREMRYFLEYVQGTEMESCNSPQQALKVLALTQGQALDKR